MLNVYYMLYKHANNQKFDKSRASTVHNLHVKAVHKRFLYLWIKAYNKQAIKPNLEAVDLFKSKMLQRRALRVLYNYRSYRIVKTSMKLNAVGIRHT